MKSGGMTPQAFATKWEPSKLKERSGSQEHFIDLCRLVGHPTPGEADPKGQFFTFEKGAAKHGGGEGWADVWYRGHFAWEYKGKHKDLNHAYNQLLKYREDLENPPLLIVSDMERFEIHCNFTGSPKREYRFDLQDLAEGRHVQVVPPIRDEEFTPPTALEVLRCSFAEPDALRPAHNADFVTQAVAGYIGEVADELRLRKIDPHRAAHFIMKILFCFFAEDVGLLPKKVFWQILLKTKENPNLFMRYATELFAAMSTGGHVLLEPIPYFDGGLFADTEVIKLQPAEIDILGRAGVLDWSSVEPAIFGTLFEDAAWTPKSTLRSGGTTHMPRTSPTS